MGEFDDALILTSPPIKGKRVKDAQYLLSGKNAFAGSSNPIHPYKGKIDGVAGPATLTAARESKYWLGYPESELYASFGQTLYECLHGLRKLSADYQSRRAERIALANLTIGHKALNVALTQIGVKENPFGSNRQPYGLWYGFNGVPWCAIFVSWCMNEVHHSEWRYASVREAVDDARYNRRGATLVTTPQVGDLMSYTTAEGPDEHIAFFASGIDSKTFNDIGGNTGPIDMSNGGEVLKQVRSYSQVSHVIRVK